tara:strand:+ start:614 stop:931 length:318 start_codon:yes stop_codon:yes gene_type:complete
MEEEMNSLKYLKDNFTMDQILENEKISNIIKLNHKRNFEFDMRQNVTYLKKKYTNLYSYIDIFKNDKNNVICERLMDIIYENIHKEYDHSIIYDDPEFILNILEK